MTERAQLQTLLSSHTGVPVYFQPPEGYTLTYPCVVYKRMTVNTQHADNKTYSRQKRYEITLMDTNPDSHLVDSLLDLPNIQHTSSFTSEGVQHDVFSIH